MRFYKRTMIALISFLLIILFLISPASFSLVPAESKSSLESVKDVGNDNGDSDKDLKGEIVFAHILYRHGDRTPVSPYPLDPWKNESDWPTGFGQLTNVGKNQHYQLGIWLRKRYASLIKSSSYSRNIIYVQSTDVDRTLMSAESNLAGMFPPERNEKWNKDILWQPIPIHSIPEKLDYVLAGQKACPAYDEEYATLRNSEEFLKIDRKLAYLYEYLTEHSGMTINTLEGVLRINNTFFIEQIYNKTLPSWTQKVFPSEDMTFSSEISLQAPTYTRRLARLKGGPLLKEILRRFSDKSQHKLNPDRSIWVYSAHDTNIASLLNTLNMFYSHSPPYAATVLLEMRIANKTPLISIFYKTSLDEPKPLTIPGCGIQCPLSRMYELYDDVIPDNWDTECDIDFRISSSLTSNEREANFAITLLGLFVGVILLGTVFYLATVYYRRRRYLGVVVC